MRNTFAKEITLLASQNSKIILLSGDIGNKLFDDFKTIDERRFINCGIAEGSMMSIASGLALNGFRPVVYTITPFTTTRCYEQIRVGVSYHECPVTIVGTGSGLSYASLGPTHHSLEDIALLRVLPKMNVLAPCDSYELTCLLNQTFLQNNATYIRIGKKGEPLIHGVDEKIQFGKVRKIKDGRSICFLSAGTIISEVLSAVHILEQKNISCAIYSNHTVKPLDAEFLKEAIKSYKLLVVVEEHGKLGGLTSSILEWACFNSIETNKIISIGTCDKFLHTIGDQKFARQLYEIDSKSIVDKLEQFL